MSNDIHPPRNDSLLRLALELIATGRELKEVLTVVVRMVEDQCDDAVGSILLLDPDGRRLRLGAAPELPAEYNRAIDGLEIGPAVGSCGTAIYRREPVIVQDIATDPLWAKYRDFALGHGLVACWSQPIFARDRQVLGSFAIYPRQARKPQLSEIELIESAAHLAGVAIERHHAEKAIRRLNETLEHRVAQRTTELEARTVELERLSERNRLLAREVEHRVVNNLTALIALVGVMRTQSHDVDSFGAAIDARLQAMAHVHKILSTSDGRGRELRALVASTLQALHCLTSHHVQEELDGPEASLDPRQGYALALILAEWFTNSCKYGAHSVPRGSLRVGWTIVQTNEGREVRLSWTERGGPSPPPEIRPSLGMDLANQFAMREMGGRCEMRFSREGAEHIIEFPIVGNG